MEPTAFADRWKSYLARTDLEAKFDIVTLPSPDNRISKTSSQFLSEIGMPNAAGFYFEDLVKGLRKIYDVYSPGDYWNDSDRKRLDAYLMFGSDDGGNPLCLDLVNHERVVFLNHERHFAVAEFVNSHVSQLAECILVFQEMVEAYQNEHGEDAELYEGNVPTSLVEQALSDIGHIDPLAVGENCYWPMAMDYI